jgi:hypothetical protein
MATSGPIRVTDDPDAQLDDQLDNDMVSEGAPVPPEA